MECRCGGASAPGFGKHYNGKGTGQMSQLIEQARLGVDFQNAVNQPINEPIDIFSSASERVITI